jgi:hypothetical protein
VIVIRKTQTLRVQGGAVPIKFLRRLEHLRAVERRLMRQNGAHHLRRSERLRVRDDLVDPFLQILGPHVMTRARHAACLKQSAQFRSGQLREDTRFKIHEALRFQPIQRAGRVAIKFFLKAVHLETHPGGGG